MKKPLILICEFAEEEAKTYKNICVYLRCLSVFTEVLLSEVQ